VSVSRILVPIAAKRKFFAFNSLSQFPMSKNNFGGTH